MSSTLYLILFPAVAMLTAALLTPVIRNIALRSGEVVAVRDDRWHKRPTPAFGGIAIVVGFAVALLVEGLLGPGGQFTLEPTNRAVLPIAPSVGLISAGAMMFVLGLADDLLHMGPATKLVGQLAAAALLVVSGIGVWLTGVYALDAVISVFWFVGITNALNLLDNMDGLAGGIAFIAAAFMGVTFVLEGQFEFALVAFSLCGALAGFLVHNYPPARIFMGDSGSLFLGLSLAGLGLSPAAGLSRELFAVVALPAVILAIPILDTTFVTITRVLEGRAVSQGGRDHTSHGLVALGVSEERAVWILWTLAAAGGGVGLFFRSASRTNALFVGGLVLAVLTLMASYMLLQRMSAAAGVSSTSGVSEAVSGGAAAGTSAEAGDVASARTDGVEQGTAGDPISRRFARLRGLNQRFPAGAFVLDFFLIGLAYYGAYLIRWSGPRLEAELVYFQRTLIMVIAAKMAAFAWMDMYAPRMRHYSLADSMQAVRANAVASLLTVAVLMLAARVGLSRGVLIVDLLACTGLTVGARFSFRMMQSAVGRWSSAGSATVVLGSLDDGELAFHWLDRNRDPAGLRAVALADPSYGGRKGRFKGYPFYGGHDALVRAVHACEAHAVVVVERSDGDTTHLDALDRYLKDVGSLDAYVIRGSIDRLPGPAPAEVEGGTDPGSRTAVGTDPPQVDAE